jgi:hypothetical protein
MPTVLRIGPYRFFFYAGDRDEPPHVHVERGKSLWKRTKSFCSGAGMSSLRTEIQAVAIQNVRVTDDVLIVELSDGRIVSVLLAWYPRLLHGTPQERRNWRLIGKGEGIHWPDLDEDISVENLLLGKPSGESQHSFKRWREHRKTKKTEQ